MATPSKRRQTTLPDFGSGDLSARPVKRTHRVKITSKPKLVIRGFSSPPKLPQHFEARSLERLSEAIDDVLNENKMSSSYETIYRSCEGLCLHKKSEPVLKVMETRVTDWITRKLKNVSPFQISGIWVGFNARFKLIKDLFLYLDRIIGGDGLQGLADRIFRQSLCESGNEVLISDYLIESIEMERRENLVSIELADVISMLEALDMYCTFELRLLGTTESWYVDVARKFVSSGDYAEICEKALAHENARIDQYIPEKTRQALISVMDEVLIKEHYDKIISSSLTDALETVDTAQLTRVYTLLSRVDKLDELAKAFGAYVLSQGSTLVTDTSKDDSMIQALLEFKKRMDSITSTSFSSDIKFVKTVRDAFERFVSERSNRPAELLARYMDNFLRSGMSGLSLAETQAMFDQLLALFRTMPNKDVFQAFYKTHLAKRLIFKTSLSIDAEKSVIQYLKQECGRSFSDDLEKMFGDVEVSKGISDGYTMSQNMSNGNSRSAIAFTANVVRQSNWPSSGKLKMVLKRPSEVEKHYRAFEAYYQNSDKQNESRRLTWDDEFAQAIIRRTFNGKAHEFQVSAHQAYVLMAFNNSKTLDLVMLEKITGIEKSQLIPILESLLSHRLVIKKSKEKVISTDDKFRINMKFTSKMYRVKVNAVQIKESEEEKTAAFQSVDIGRRDLIDAAIVRIMKTKQTMSHPLLIAGVVSQLKFTATVTDIKRRIESMLEKEYIERDANDSKVYNYIA